MLLYIKAEPMMAVKSCLSKYRCGLGVAYLLQGSQHRADHPDFHPVAPTFIQCRVDPLGHLGNMPPLRGKWCEISQLSDGFLRPAARVLQ